MKPELPDGNEYEPDDEASLATLIIADTPQYHNLHSPVDEDWLRFTAEEFVLIDEDDDGGTDLFSQITFMAPATGGYGIVMSYMIMD